MEQRALKALEEVMPRSFICSPMFFHLKRNFLPIIEKNLDEVNENVEIKHNFRYNRLLSKQRRK